MTTLFPALQPPLPRAWVRDEGNSHAQGPQELVPFSSGAGGSAMQDPREQQQELFLESGHPDQAEEFLE